MNFTLHISNRSDWKNKDKKVKGPTEWKQHKNSVKQLIKKRTTLSNQEVNSIEIKCWERNRLTETELIRGEAPDDVASQLDQQTI